LTVSGLMTISAAAGVPSGWEVGSYWTYQQVERVQSASDIPMGTITYYVVARSELLYTAMCAVARVDKSPGGRSILSLLTVHMFRAREPATAGMALPCPSSSDNDR